MVHKTGHGSYGDWYDPVLTRALDKAQKEVKHMIRNAYVGGVLHGFLLGVIVTALVTIALT